MPPERFTMAIAIKHNEIKKVKELIEEKIKVEGGAGKTHLENLNPTKRAIKYIFGSKAPKTKDKNGHDHYDPLPDKELDRLNHMNLILSFGVYGGTNPAIWVEFGSCNREKTYSLENPFAVDNASHAIMAWLFGKDVEQGDMFSTTINQGIRHCEVMKVNKTRLRLEYEMPNAGLMGGWHHLVVIFGRKIYGCICARDHHNE